MSGVNKVILVGNLGSDPDMKYTPSGQAVCEFSLATSESWNDKNGTKQEKTEWHRIVVWGKRAEVCSKYLAKGRQAFVEGRITTRTWEKDGQKHYKTEIVANDVQFLGGGSKGGNGERRSDTAPAEPPAFDTSDSNNNDSIPF